jgi:hypothetical protein
MEKIALDPESGIELQTYIAGLDGYLAGVKAAIEAAKQIRVDQIIKAHRAKQDALQNQP